MNRKNSLKIKNLTMHFMHYSLAVLLCSLFLLNPASEIPFHNSNNNGFLGNASGQPAGINTVGASNLDYGMISAGFLHTLALKADGTVWAWGNNELGQLGDGTQVSKNVPVQVRGRDGAGYLIDIIAVSAGYYHSLALRSDGTVWSWGNNGDGQLGDNTDTTRLTPVNVRGTQGTGQLSGIVSISAGGFHSMALGSDGRVLCWGANNLGQAGDMTNDMNKYYPVLVRRGDGSSFLSGIGQISAGYFHSFAVTEDGMPWGWGYNGNGQLGDGTYDSIYTAGIVLGPGGSGLLENVKKISSGHNHTAALLNDGSVYMWGMNNLMQLGDGTADDRNYPVRVLGVEGSGFLSGIEDIDTGRLHTLALDSSGSIYSWGSNYHGQIGNGLADGDYPSYSVEPYPVRVQYTSSTFITGVTKISAGGGHSLASMGNGYVVAWGTSHSGQVGGGEFTPQNSYGETYPVIVSGPSQDERFFISPAIKPHIPGSFTVPPFINDGNYVLSWQASSYSIYYEVFENDVLFNSTVGLSTSIESKPNGTYHYKVRGVNQNGTSSFTNTFTTVVHYPAYPSIPEFLTSSFTSTTGTYTVSWKASDYGYLYALYENGTKVYENTGLSTMISGRHNGTYSYRLFATNINGSTWSQELLITVHLPAWPSVPVFETESFRSVGGSYTVSWQRADYADSYIIYENDAEIYSGPVLSRLITAKENGTYIYRVRSVNNNATSSNSTALTITVHHPAWPSITSINEGSFTSYDGNYNLTWGESQYAEGYELYENSILVYNGTLRVFQVSGKSNGTFSYRLRAWNSNTTTILSTPIEVLVMKPSVPMLFILTPVDDLREIPIVINFTAENNIGFKSAGYYSDHEQVPLSGESGPWSVRLFSSSRGENTLRIVLIDNAGILYERHILYFFNPSSRGVSATVVLGTSVSVFALAVAVIFLMKKNKPAAAQYEEDIYNLNEPEKPLIEPEAQSYGFGYQPEEQAAPYYPPAPAQEPQPQAYVPEYAPYQDNSSGQYTSPQAYQESPYYVDDGAGQQYYGQPPVYQEGYVEAAAPPSGPVMQPCTHCGATDVNFIPQYKRYFCNICKKYFKN